MQADFAKLDRAFNPRCIVVIGDSPKNEFRWLRAQSTFKGKLYSVQVNAETAEKIKALGIENYTSLVDIPEPVDLVIVAAPRAAAMHVLDDCIRKDVAAVHFYTSGFSEVDTEDGRELERAFIAKAEAANLHVIGPNCMGVFNPGAGVKQTREQYSGSSGPVGFISQSGTHAINFSLDAHLQSIDIWKGVSFGNGVVLDSNEFLEYFGQDPEIKVIGMYLEGVKDGRRFLQSLKEVASRKPVVIWKGGRTEAGGRAIASHTGSLAVSQAIWDAAVKQCGAVTVARLDEMIDTVKALLYLAPVHGDRVAVAGGSGGQSVAIADVFTEAGLKVPTLTKASYDEFASFFTLIGGGYRNPIDTGNPNREQMRRIMYILERDENIDNLVMVLSLRWSRLEQLQDYVKLLGELRARSPKSISAIAPFYSPREMTDVRTLTQQLQAVNVPAFTTMERGAFALKKALFYYSFRRENGGS